jgi:hypothetical protein
MRIRFARNFSNERKKRMRLEGNVRIGGEADIPAMQADFRINDTGLDARRPASKEEREFNRAVGS